MSFSLSRPQARAGFAAAALLISVPSLAQAPQWFDMNPLPWLSSPQTVYDRARQEIVHVGLSSTFGATQTWLWDGAHWRQGADLPLPVFNFATAYDEQRQRVVLFGGTHSVFPDNETFEWNGSQWTQRNPAVRPPGLSHHAMTYDLARGRVVVFGGYRSNAQGTVTSDDTWEYDGTSWVLAQPAQRPPAAARHDMVYDQARGLTILPFQNEVWEYDGQTWAQRTFATQPAFGGGLAYLEHRGRVLLLANGQGQTPSETWEYDGTAWYQLNPGIHPPYLATQNRLGMAYDPVRRVAVVGGPYGSTWEYDDYSWEIRTVRGAPPATSLMATVYDDDRDRLVMFSGRDAQGLRTDAHWEFDGLGWNQRYVYPRPAARDYHRMVYDRRRGVTVLHGGYDGQVRFNDTWEYDGNTWTQVSGAPIGREGHMMAYDTEHEVTVVFGGYVGSGVYANDTWLYDGQWQAVSPASRPPGRSNAAMAFDEERGVSVLFGGFAPGSGQFNDTWLFDGQDWTQAQPAHSPPGRDRFEMTYDRLRKRVVLFGGQSASGGHDVWEWDGTDWTQVQLNGGPEPRNRHMFIYHPERARIVTFGGRNQSLLNTLGDLWELEIPLVGSVSGAGTGCPGSAGTPVVVSSPGSTPRAGLPWSVSLANLPTGGGVAFLILGLSNTTWGPTPLPFDLAQFGAPGCLLLNAGDFQVPVFNFGGSASLTLVLPNLPGLDAYMQGIVSDPGAANQAGLTVSNSLHFVVGQ